MEVKSETQRFVEFRKSLLRMGASGGPLPHEYQQISEGFYHLSIALKRGVVNDSALRLLLLEMGEAMSPLTMQGFAYCKPHNYAGDFEIIDRIYTEWLSPRQDLVRWDHYFHAQAAPKAVSNRKAYFYEWLANIEARGDRGSFRVLNVGSGPARDVFEFYSRRPLSAAHMDCLDQDEHALAYATTLCAPFQDRISFLQGNALRFHPQHSYRAIWSAGLFDYLSDRLFSMLVRRLVRHLEPGGELVVGNFSPGNPTRAYMEIVGQWMLNHRTPAELLELAKLAGIPSSAMSVHRESEGVNLFLHITKSLDHENST